MSLLSAPTGGPASGRDLRRRLRSILITGFALTVPLLVTVMILVFVVNFILQAISPVVGVVTSTFGIGSDVDEVVLEVLAIATFVLLAFVIGLVAEYRQGDELERVFDTAMARIPGVGSLYTSFNEMTELLLSNDTQSFQEVKLVEFPVEGSYTLAFVTSESPDPIEGATDTGEMTTLFLPMAPNPVMGGHVIHVSTERVHDVDLTVEEGIRSIVTSGVATGENGAPDEAELVDLTAIRRQARSGVAEFTTQARRDLAAVHPELDPAEDDEREITHYLLSEGNESGATEGDPGSTDPDAEEASDDASDDTRDDSTGDGDR